MNLKEKMKNRSISSFRILNPIIKATFHALRRHHQKIKIFWEKVHLKRTDRICLIYRKNLAECRLSIKIITSKVRKQFLKSWCQRDLLDKKSLKSSNATLNYRQEKIIWGMHTHLNSLEEGMVDRSQKDIHQQSN
jgi:hypothetical protein